MHCEHKNKTNAFCAGSEVRQLEVWRKLSIVLSARPNINKTEYIQTVCDQNSEIYTGTVDAAYKTRGYKVLSLILVLDSNRHNSLHVSEYIETSGYNTQILLKEPTSIGKKLFLKHVNSFDRISK